MSVFNEAVYVPNDKHTPQPIISLRPVAGKFTLRVVCERIAPPIACCNFPSIYSIACWFFFSQHCRWACVSPSEVSPVFAGGLFCQDIGAWHYEMSRSPLARKNREMN